MQDPGAREIPTILRKQCLVYLWICFISHVQDSREIFFNVKYSKVVLFVIFNTFHLNNFGLIIIVERLSLKYLIINFKKIIKSSLL